MTDDIILLNMNCANCGGVIDPETMTCKSCGTPYLIKNSGKVHILQVEVGDMPHAEVEHLMRHYQLALKSALSKETKIMLVPIRNGQGSVTIQTIEE